MVRLVKKFHYFYANLITMTEDFLHYLWKYRLLKPTLRLVTGEDCMIIDVGIHNHNAGPDFFNARIKIDDTIWAGNVEIHFKSSDWLAHKHHLDKAYENVILHIVGRNNKTLLGKDGKALPTLEVSEDEHPAMFKRYSDFMTNRNWIACEKLLNRVDRFVINNWLDRMMIERLELKTAEIQSQLQFNNNNWEQTFYEFLARNFGFKVNTLPFDLLAKSLNLAYLAKHKNNILQIEALIFGQAGMLESNFKDIYPINLQREYQFLKKKYRLTNLDHHIWQFMRLRPSNFPTVRLAQFSNLVFRSSHLFSKILEANSLGEIISMFNASVSEYWLDHYLFDKPSAKRAKNLGIMAIHLIIINTVIPFLFVFGKIRNEQDIVDKSLRFLDQLPGEVNAVIKKWETLGMSVRTAFNTQALIELKANYCDHKKCLKCAFGNELLKQELN
jgi:hypothetical protein